MKQPAVRSEEQGVNGSESVLLCKTFKNHGGDGVNLCRGKIAVAQSDMLSMVVGGQA